MKTLLALTCICVLNGQVSSNWTTYGGDPQHSGWERTDTTFSKDTVKDLQLLWKMKLETRGKGSSPIMPPLIMGRLISYRGFKELAFVGTNADMVYAIDVDLGKPFWQKHLEYSTDEPQTTTACSAGMTAMPTMPPPAGRGGGRGAAPPGGGAGRGSSSPFLGAGPASVYAISSDGRLHRLNSSTGDDMVQPVKVLPANATTLALNMSDNVIYASTSSLCNGAPNAIWSIDLTTDPPSVATSDLKNPPFSGPLIGSDGTVYQPRLAPATIPGGWDLFAFTPRELHLKQTYSGSFRSPGASISPVVFTHKGKEMLATGDWAGGLVLLDPSAATAPLYRTPVIAPNGSYGSLSSWQETTGAAWILAAVTGPVSAELKLPATNGSAPSGSIMAFKVEDRDGKPILTPAWVSRDIASPLSPVIANGIVFALSSGPRATLYALDAATGKELYSSHNLVNGPASLAGLTVANGRVYFGTQDGTLYAFGMYMEH
jgi:outer membrane protein assembly factor BamB